MQHHRPTARAISDLRKHAGRRAHNTLTVLFLLAIFIAGPLAEARADDPIRLSYNSDWSPYSYDTGVDVKGILPDLMHEIVAKRMNHPIAQYGSPWSRAQRYVQVGDLDGFVTTPTAERLDYTVRSKNIVYKFEMRAVVKRDGKAHEMLRAPPGIALLKKLKVCRIAGNSWGKRFYGKHEIRYREAARVRSCLKRIKRGRSDVLIQPYAVAIKEIVDARMQKDLIVLPHVYGGMEFALMVSKRSPYAGGFLKKFDRTVSEMKRDGSFDRILARLHGEGATTE